MLGDLWRSFTSMIRLFLDNSRKISLAMVRIFSLAELMMRSDIISYKSHLWLLDQRAYLPNPLLFKYMGVRTDMV